MKNILVFISIIAVIQLQATNYSTIASGDWDQTSTWQGGAIPPLDAMNNDVLTINNSHTVNLYDYLEINNTNTFYIFGNLYIHNNLTANNNLTIVVTGKLFIEGNIICNNNALASITGNVIVTGNLDINNNADIEVDGSLTVYGDFTGDSNNELSGQGYVNVGGTFSGVGHTGFSGNINQNLQSGVGLNNNGCYIRMGSDDVIRVANANGNYNNMYTNGFDGLINSDGTLIIEGNWFNYSGDNVFTNRNASGSVRFNGTGSQTVGGSKPTLFENVVIDNTSGVQIGNDLAITNSLDFANGNIITGLYDTVIILNTSTSSILNMDADKAVEGNLRRYVSTGIYNFPLIDDGDYLPATIEILNVGSMHFISGKFIGTTSETPPAGLAVGGTPIIAFLDKGYWNFTPNNGSGVQYNITLTSRGHTNGADLPEQHAIFKRDGGDWLNVGTHNNATQSGSGTGPISVTRSGLTGFSDFIIGFSESNPLPIVLKSFYGIGYSGYNELYWETSSELNNQYFIIEHSTDGREYNQVGRVEGAGTSNYDIKYSFQHTPVIGDMHFYKLTQVDYDGRSVSYPEIVIINNESGKKDLIFTELKTSRIKFSLNSDYDQEIQVWVVDQLGKSVATSQYQVVNGYNTLELNPTSINQGAYIFRVHYRFTQKSYKIILY